MLRIGLTQRVEIVADRDERRDCLDQAWTALLVSNGLLPIPLPNTVENVDMLVRELALDGVILTGGNDLAHLPGGRSTAPERDAFERKLLTYCSQQEMPVLGVCRGMQVMVDYYGGPLVTVSDHVATRHPIMVQSSRIASLGDREDVNSFHDFGIDEEMIRSPLCVVATAPDGCVEAVAHATLPQWGIMWHPERLPCDARDGHLIRTLFAGGRT